MTRAHRTSLRSIVADPDTVIFLGAGASVSTGLPLGNDGAVRIIEILFHTIRERRTWVRLNRLTRTPPIAWPRFEVVVGHLAQFNPAAAAAIVRTFRDIGLSATHQLLAARSPKPRLWLTTNFDDQIERALDLEGQPFHVVNDRERIPGILKRLREHIVVKLHGDGGSRAIAANLGVRIDQILRPFPNIAENSLLRLAAHRPILFVGYAVRDWDLRPFVTRLVHGAPSVGWVGYGAPAADVLAFTRRKNVRYDGRGAPHALEDALRVTASPAMATVGEWEARIGAWLGRQNRDQLVQAAAELLFERGDHAARRASVQIQRTIDHRSVEDRYWCLRRDGELAMRAHPFVTQQVSAVAANLVRIGQSRTARRRIRALALLQAASMLRRTVGSRQAAALLYRVMRIAKHDAAIRADAQSLVGYVNIFRGGRRFSSGLSELRRAHLSALRLRDPLRIINTANTLSVGLMRSDALECASEAEALLRSSEPFLREINSPRALMIWHVNLAEALRIQRKFAGAVAENATARTLAVAFGDREAEMNVLANLGLCHLVTGDVGSAERLSRLAGRMARLRGGGEIVGNTLLNRGWIRTLLGLWDAAIPWLRRAASELEKYGSTDRAASTRAMAGWCYVRRGNARKAREIVHDIEGHGESPQGLLAPEFLMLRFAVAHGNSDAATLPEQIMVDFALHCEQRAQLLLWVLERRGGADRTTVRAVARAVEEARIVPLAAAAAQLLVSVGIPPPRPIQTVAAARTYAAMKSALLPR